MKKYKLTENTIQHEGRILYQIQAVKGFGYIYEGKLGGVKKGELGGYVESEANLSHEGNCWVYDSAWVFGNAQVFSNAQVYGNAWVFGNAQVYGNATVYGNAKVWLDSEVSHGEFSEDLWHRIHQYEGDQIVYTENLKDTLIQIQYKNQTFNLDKRLKSKEEIIKKTLQLYKIIQTDQDLLEGLL